MAAVAVAAVAVAAVTAVAAVVAVVVGAVTVAAVAVEAMAVAAVALPLPHSPRLTLVKWDVEPNGLTFPARKKYQAGVQVGDLFKKQPCLGSVPICQGSMGPWAQACRWTVHGSLSGPETGFLGFSPSSPPPTSTTTVWSCLPAEQASSGR